jgi:hypothetical protein
MTAQTDAAVVHEVASRILFLSLSENNYTQIHPGPPHL